MDDIEIVQYKPDRTFLNSFEHLSLLWKTMQAEDKLDAICPSIDPEEWGFRGFMNSVTESDFWQVVFNDNVVGCVWMQNFKPNRAEMHFITFGMSKKRVKIARKVLPHLLKHYALDVIYGFIPASNMLAIKFATMAGCEITGIIPHGSYNYKKKKSYDSVLLTYKPDTLKIK